MEKWQKLLAQSLTSPDKLAGKLGLEPGEMARVLEQYPARINPYLLGLISRSGPVWRQCVPDQKELKDGHGQTDPLKEEKYSPVKGLIHRYPDRVLLYVSNVCASYCRFCTRKRQIGFEYVTLKPKDFRAAIAYIKKHQRIRDVILSGGDPLMLEDRLIEKYLKALRSIGHVEIIRVDTRAVFSLPQRITPQLCRLLKKHQPLYLMTHFNHPKELTKEARAACRRLGDAGLVLGNQSVLLKGVNDDARTLKQLGEELLKVRVRPYYLYIPDAVKGTYHFRVPIRRALKIMRQLIGHTSGLAVPKLILDLEGGGGKLPLTPKYVVRKRGKEYTFRNFEDRKFTYHDV
ncbi:MAG: KamA family radical SAM protein [Candidatus Saganbacteria bacterium]|nr:KamA family radical SAM protein [Candidatus Saganbacteria bacterium]